jgi:hypothetical protein
MRAFDHGIGPVACPPRQNLPRGLIGGAIHSNDQKARRTRSFRTGGSERTGRRPVLALYVLAENRDWRSAKSHGVYRLEKLRVRNMTASAKGTAEEPGKNVAQKSGLNRSILDQGWGMFATFLGYKEQERGGRVEFTPAPYTSLRCPDPVPHGTGFAVRSAVMKITRMWSAQST